MMTTMKKLALGLSAAALSIGGLAYAQGMGDHPKMDADGNGAITRAESQAAAAAMFAKLDVNKDGKLDQADRDQHRQDMRGRIFAKLDANGDGSISKTEFMADRGPDGDDPDGMAGHGMGGPGMGGPGKDGHRGRHGHGMRGHGGGMMMMMDKMADTNNDGAVSEAEFTAAAAKHFDMMDTNHDGQVSKEERATAHQAMKAKWDAKKAEKRSAQ